MCHEQSRSRSLSCAQNDIIKVTVIIKNSIDQVLNRNQLICVIEFSFRSISFVLFDGRMSPWSISSIFRFVNVLFLLFFCCLFKDFFSLSFSHPPFLAHAVVVTLFFNSRVWRYSIVCTNRKLLNFNIITSPADVSSPAITDYG